MSYLILIIRKHRDGVFLISLSSRNSVATATNRRISKIWRRRLISWIIGSIATAGQEADAEVADDERRRCRCVDEVVTWRVKKIKRALGANSVAKWIVNSYKMW